MGLPASGALTISNIKLEVNNSTTYSLDLLSNYANKSNPDSMSEFYNYGSTFQLNAGLTTIGFGGNYGVLPQGGYVICGVAPAGNTNYSMVKLFPNGQVDTGFAQYATQAMRGAAYSSVNDRYYGYGTFGFYGTWSKPFLVSCTSNGAPDTSFNSGGSGFSSNGYVNGLAPLPNGQLIVVGDFTTYNGVQANKIARLNANGTIDTSFNSGGYGADNSLQVVAYDSISNKILIGSNDGGVCYNGNCTNGLVRLNYDGTFDSTFNSGGSGISGGGNSIIDIRLDSTGKIYITGWFNQYNGVSRGAGYCRLNNNGTLDTSFVPDSGNTGDGVAIGGDDLPVVKLRNNNGNGYWRKLTSTGGYNSTFNTAGTSWSGQPGTVIPTTNNTYIIYPTGDATYNGADTGGRNICRISASGALLGYS